MFRSLKELERCNVSAADGDIGCVQNFLLDDERWIIRYLVTDTSGLTNRKQVLISPISFRQVNWYTKEFHLALTKDEIQNSPRIDPSEPVSRQQELDYSGYYGYPCYWDDSGLWGMSDYPGSLAAARWHEMFVQNAENCPDAHLHSANVIRGFRVMGRDTSIGDIEDFIIDDQTWEVRFLVVDASSWWPGERVLIAPHWTTSIDWASGTAHVDLPRLLVKNCPRYNSTWEINREYETRVHDYYGRTLQRNRGLQSVGVPSLVHGTSYLE